MAGWKCLDCGGVSEIKSGTTWHAKSCAIRQDWFIPLYAAPPSVSDWLRRRADAMRPGSIRGAAEILREAADAWDAERRKR